jgi:hypothetical protein
MTAMDITVQASFLPHNDPDIRDPAGNLICIQELR